MLSSASPRSRLGQLRRVAIAAALLAPLAAVAQQPVYFSMPAQLFAGPDMRYPVVASIYPGLDAEVMGCLDGYEWCDVMLPDGMRGWVFGNSLTYPWMGNGLPLPQYGASLGIPLITFIVGDYWGHHYRHQPWYDEPRWRQPQPRFVPRPDPGPWGGWQQPYPPRWERDRERDFERPRDYNPPRRDERWNNPPRQDRDPNRGGNVTPNPTPFPGGPGFQQRPDPGRTDNRPDVNRPDAGRNFPPRQDRFEAPRTQPAPAPVPVPQPQPRPNIAPPPAQPPAAMPAPQPRFEPPRAQPDERRPTRNVPATRPDERHNAQ